MNLSKSSLTPSQSLDYLGITLQTHPLRTFPTQARIRKVLSLEEFISSRQHPLSTWRSLVGVMSSMSSLVPGARLQMCSLQLRLNVAGALALEDALVSWDDSCLQDLRWWSNVAHLNVGIPLDLPHPALLLFTDASEVGWGVSLRDDHMSSSWYKVSLTFSINHWELLAVLLAVHGFLHLLTNQSVALFSDNTTALAYLRKEGGTRSSSLNSVAQAILRLCESHGVHLLPQFIPGHLNVLADSLSRGSQVVGSEWTLCREVCSELFRRWPVTIDLFATSLNHRLPIYFSLMVDPQSAGTDSMLQPWDNLQAYAFFPFNLIPWVLSKVRLSQSGGNSRGSLLAPQTLVPRSFGVASGGSVPPSFTEGSTQTSPLSSFSSEPPRASTDWLSYHE